MLDSIIAQHKSNFQRSRRFVDLSKKVKEYLKTKGKDTDREEYAEICLKLRSGTEENYYLVKTWLKDLKAKESVRL